MKTAVIDTGGGLRGIYGAGVFDYCIENSVSFSHCIGISAGSANAASFLAGQKGRNYRFYTDYSMRREYMSVGNLVKNHSYLNLDYIYGELSNTGGEDPLDFDAIMNNPSEYTVVATDAQTGAPKYFTKDDLSRDDYAILKASCCIPGVCRAYEIDDRFYYDGGVSDPVPIEYAFSQGADKVVLILTKPVETEDSFEMEKMCASLLHRRFPNTSSALLKREEKYRNGIALAKKLEAEQKLLIVAPGDIGKLKTLTKDKAMLTELYMQGKKDAEAIADFIRD